MELTNLQKMPNGGFKLKPNGKLNSQYKGGLVTDYVWMKNKCDSGLSLSDIAKLSDRSKRTVVRWLDKHKLSTKKILKFNYGINHHNFNGNSICKCGNKKFCTSKTCRECYVKLKKMPDKNLFGNNINNEIKQYVRTNIVPNWRNNIYERDNYKCQKCGDNCGGNLEAHHKKRLSFLIDNIINENKNINILELINIVCTNSEILSIDNGITLCKKCHKELHKGKRKNVYLL